MLGTNAVRATLTAAMLAAIAAVSAQQAPPSSQRALEPKDKLVAAIRQLAEGVSGRYGDEGALVWSAIEAMHAALIEWDEALLAYEAALPPSGTQRHALLGVAHLDRRRLERAGREL